MASIRGILNIQSLNELTSEKSKSIICHVFLDTSWNPHGLRMR